MPSQIKSVLINIGVIGIIVGTFFGITLLRSAEIDQLTGINFPPNNTGWGPNAPQSPEDNLRSSAASAISFPPKQPEPQITPPVSQAETKQTLETTPENKSQTISPTVTEARETSATIRRIENPYSFPPKSFTTVNEEARAAIANIYCAARNGSLKSTSGTGVIIDPRGVILTNAHVAQYVLLSSDPRVDLSCVIRGGSPARDLWSPEILYIPPIWVNEHAGEIKSTRAMSTGEHDYALLRIVGAIGDAKIPLSFPYLPVDTREAIGFIDDPVLVASYPAEFLGGIASQYSLYPVSSVTNIKDLLTFEFNSVDVVSLGGIIGAQGGSSGGAVVNAWGRLIGIITTTSEGTTTADRDLRALTLSYVSRDISQQAGLVLESILSGNIAEQAAAFHAQSGPILTQILINNISSR